MKALIMMAALAVLGAGCAAATEPEVITSIVYLDATTTSTTTTTTTTTVAPTTTTIDYYEARDEAAMAAEDAWWSYIDSVETALRDEGYGFMLPLDVEQALETGWLLCDFMDEAQNIGVTPDEAFFDLLTVTLDSFDEPVQDYGIVYSGASVMSAAAYLCPENLDFAWAMAES